MKKAILFCVLLLFSVVSFSQDVSTVDYEITYIFSSSGKTNKIKFICLVPADIKGKQKVHTLTYSRQPQRVFSEDGDHYAEFIMERPSKEEKIKISVTIDIYRNDFQNRKKDIAQTGTDMEKYLKNEKFIEKDDPLIIEKAGELKKKTREATIRKIYSFVRNHIQYESHEDELGSVEAFKIKRGDCTEFADLFIALCRACDIPARFAEGFVTNITSNPKHDWAEVYLEGYGWIRFDPTSGNLNEWNTLQNRYIQLTNTRFNRTINNGGHYWAYRYWGDPIKVSQSFVINKYTAIQK
jgi:transglutaminase-like putative cysteine protease